MARSAWVPIRPTEISRSATWLWLRGSIRSGSAQRQSMLATVDNHFRQLEKSDALTSMDTFYQRAYSLISSKEAREAFNLKAEPDAIKEQYGRGEAGMRMLDGSAIG